MRGRMLEDGQQLAETWDQCLAAQDWVLQPPLTVFWEGEISLEVNPPFPGPGGLYCTPTFSGGEAGRRALRSFRPNDLALCEQALEAVKAWGWRMRSSSSGDASCGLQHFCGEWEPEHVPWSGAGACPHDFLDPAFRRLSVGMPATDNVWLEFGTKDKKPIWRHRCNSKGREKLSLQSFWDVYNFFFTSLHLLHYVLK